MILARVVATPSLSQGSIYRPRPRRPESLIRVVDMQVNIALTDISCNYDLEQGKPAVSDSREEACCCHSAEFFCCAHVFK